MKNKLLVIFIIVVMPGPGNAYPAELSATGNDRGHRQHGNEYPVAMVDGEKIHQNNVKEKNDDMDYAEKQADGAAEKKKPVKNSEKAVDEVRDRAENTAERERLERDRLEKEKADKKNSEREKKVKEEARELERSSEKGTQYHHVRREYLALFTGYGGHVPVADYGGRFMASHLFSCTAGIYVMNFWGLSPELHFRYTEMRSAKRLFTYDSSMIMAQFYPGLVYRHHFKVPINTLTLYGRIWDGFSHIEYTSLNPYFLFIKERISEYVNIFGLSVGCYYDLWQGIVAGADFTYSVAFTAGKPLQSVAVTMNIGYRIF